MKRKKYDHINRTIATALLLRKQKFMFLFHNNVHIHFKILLNVNSRVKRHIGTCFVSVQVFKVSCAYVTYISISGKNFNSFKVHKEVVSKSFAIYNDIPHYRELDYSNCSKNKRDVYYNVRPVSEVSQRSTSNQRQSH